MLFISPVLNAFDLREFTSSDGRKMIAILISSNGDDVVIKTKSGKEFTIPMKSLSKADQLYVTEAIENAEITPKDDPEGLRSNDQIFSGSLDLALEQGKLIPLVKTPEGSHYSIYIPKSLKKGRLAPLFFYTNSGGGKSGKLLINFKEMAEVLGWVIAISEESSNRNTSGTRNSVHSSRCIAHILETLPVDGDRIIYTGVSGGAATAFHNTVKKRGIAVLSDVAYIPREISKPKVTYLYAVGGASDYNRYTTAYAANLFKKNGFHHMVPGKHRHSPDECKQDGMLWIQSRFYEDKQSKYKDEAEDFVRHAIIWLKKLSKKDSMRSYANAKVLEKHVKVSSDQAANLGALISHLEQDPLNKLYYEGLLELNELSSKYLDRGKSIGSAYGHINEKAAKAAKKIEAKYADIPVLSQIIKGIQSKSQSK